MQIVIATGSVPGAHHTSPNADRPSDTAATATPTSGRDPDRDPTPAATPDPGRDRDRDRDRENGPPERLPATHRQVFAV
jgi:hypothetical protein